MSGAYELLPVGDATLHRKTWSSRRKAGWLVLASVLAVLLWRATGTRQETAAISVKTFNLLSVTRSSTLQPSLARTTAADSPDNSPPTLFEQPKPCNRLTTSRIHGQTWMSPSPALPLSASLSERLQLWLESPIAPQSNWTHFNRQTCGSEHVTRATNKLHERGNVAVWRRQNEAQVVATRRELISMLKTAVQEGRIPPRLNDETAKHLTRGVVFTAGNADTMTRVLVSLRLLRSYNSTLPAEVFHFPTEEPSSEIVDELAKLNATVRTVSGLSKQHDPARAKSFHIKGAALVQASFDEVLYLDSDSMPVRRVDELFESRGFRALGAMFWSDYWKDSADNAIWSIIGVQCRDEWTMESGQILINRRMHMDALLLVEHMLKDWKTWFHYSDGDKDLFRYAMLALRKRWAIPGRPVSPASWSDTGLLGAANEGKFCGHTMIQSDAEGEPAFVHANLLKRIVGVEFNVGGTWARTLRLALKAPLAAHNSTFVLQADHLANANSQGIALLPAPPHVRERATLERGLHAEFWDGHKNVAYVLCINSTWSDVPPPASLTNHDRTMEQCGPSSTLYEGAQTGQMEIVDWKNDAHLGGFEAAFYDKGGKANARGFR